MVSECSPQKLRLNFDFLGLPGFRAYVVEFKAEVFRVLGLGLKVCRDPVKGTFRVTEIPLTGTRIHPFKPEWGLFEYLDSQGTERLGLLKGSWDLVTRVIVTE